MGERTRKCPLRPLQPRPGTWHWCCLPSAVNIGLYNGVTAARASERRLEAITSNLANLGTPGHKRTSTGTRAFSVPGGSGDLIELSTFAQTDFGQGPLNSSASPYHFALEGPGFFAVEGPDGELFTRNGAFHVDQDGILQTAEGFPVSWDSAGAPIDPTGEEISVDGIGTVKQGGVEIGVLRVAGFAKPHELGSIGGGYYEASQAAGEQPADAVIRQRFLEGSNVQGVDELVAMITIQRDFESARNVMQLIDQSYGRLTAI